MLTVKGARGGEGEPRELKGRCVSGGVRDAPRSSEPCPSPRCCPEPPASPGSLKYGWRVQVARCWRWLWRALRGAGQVQPGAERRPRPFRCSHGVATCSCSSPPPSSSGREGVNLPASQQEYGAINTHSPAVCQSAPSPREQGAGTEGESSPLGRGRAQPGPQGPELLLGTVRALCQPHPALTHLQRQVLTLPPGGRRCHPLRENKLS